MESFEGGEQPAPLRAVERCDRSVEVAPVLWPGGLGLEQQRAVGPQIRNPINRAADHEPPRCPQARFAPVHPGVVAARFDHHIDAPPVRRRVEDPMLTKMGRCFLGGFEPADFTAASDVEHELAEVTTDGREIAARNSTDSWSESMS